ncbi:MAG TPA: outer membrane protein assembly factor BamE [Xanthomonadales bacterium]|nr:outer membrane protein assembly factor BamE [Xanthomonadales bacterium]
MVRLAFLLLAALSLASCGVIYQVPVNQGNLLEQDMVDSLKPGMTKRQVALIMGTPSVQSPFDEDRWSYTSSFKRRGKPAQVKTLTLFFEDNLLVRMEGDYFPERDQELLDESRKIRGRHVDPLDETPRKDERERGS